MVNEKPAPRIEHCIYLVRRQRVMLDVDLARIYGVSTGRLNEQVRRNIHRFPSDFMFELTREEFRNLISHFAISSSVWGGRRKPPLVFTQEGVAMLSAVLHSPRAIEANIAVMRAFVKFRETLAIHDELAAKLRELEGRIEGHDLRIGEIFGAIRELMAPPKETPRRIGFKTD